MAAYQCTFCGYTYDEAQGDTLNGVAAGAPWAELPEDWRCPDCGATKEAFDKV